jgi:hypothetical protein
MSQRRNRVRHLENLLAEWADWRCRMLEQSCIGYPKQTAESRMREGVLGMTGRGGSRAPEVMMRGPIAEVDRAIRLMPAPCRAAIERRYCEPGSGEEKPSGAYWRNLDRAHHWVEAALTLKYEDR